MPYSTTATFTLLVYTGNAIVITGYLLDYDPFPLGAMDGSNLSVWDTPGGSIGGAVSFQNCSGQNPNLDEHFFNLIMA